MSSQEFIIAVFLIAAPLTAQSARPSCALYQRAPRSPYVLQISAANGGKLTYIGVLHTTNARSAEISAIDRQWKRVRPTKAFSEGGVWPLVESREIAIQKYGEGGFIRFLAARANILTESLEPPAAGEAARLTDSFSSEQVKLFYVLRQVQQYARMHGSMAPDEYVNSVITDVSRTHGLIGNPSNIAEMEQSIARNLPDLRNWRQIPESWFYPFTSEHWTNVLSCRSSLFRDEYMVELLTRSVQRGERVLAVVGVGHLTTQEPKLKANLAQSARPAKTLSSPRE